MPIAHRDVRWEVVVAPETRFRRLDAEALVFDPVRWETRLLTQLSAAVFEALLKAPATAEEVASKVADPAAGASAAEVLGRVREILDELNRFDLVRPCADVQDANQ